MPKWSFRICIFVVLVSFILPSLAYAYLDPGTGSYIFQLLIAGLVGFLFVVGAYWKRIKAFLTGLLKRNGKASQDGETNEDD